MALTEVFNLHLDYAPLLPHERAARMQYVEKDILALAALEKEELTFHRFVNEDLLGGGPSLLIEASAAFAKKLLTLEHVTTIQTPHLPTEPRPVQPSFTGK